MKRAIPAAAVLLSLCAALAAQPPGTPAKVTPKLEPVAETKLLMEGLALPNFRSLDRQLKQKPADPQVWVFARGQALLIAETANLLMLRPPKNQGQAQWFEHAMQLRAGANQLAVHLGKGDYERSRAGLQALANQCNRCHQTFRVPVDITPFAEPPPAVQKSTQRDKPALDFAASRP